jgi:hypothetical protein
MEINPAINSSVDKNKTEEEDVRRKFRILVTVLNVCVGIVVIILIAAVGHRIYLIQTGDKVEGMAVESTNFGSSYVNSGYFNYKGKKYAINPGNFTGDDYKPGPVVVYVNPNRPMSYFIHPPNKSKYRTAIEGSELWALVAILGFWITFNAYGLKKLLAGFNHPYPYAKK